MSSALFIITFVFSAFIANGNISPLKYIVTYPPFSLLSSTICNKFLKFYSCPLAYNNFPSSALKSLGRFSKLLESKINTALFWHISISFILEISFHFLKVTDGPLSYSVQSSSVLAGTEDSFLLESSLFKSNSYIYSYLFTSSPHL